MIYLERSRGTICTGAQQNVAVEYTIQSFFFYDICPVPFPHLAERAIAHTPKQVHVVHTTAAVVVLFWPPPPPRWWYEALHARCQCWQIQACT